MTRGQVRAGLPSDRPANLRPENPNNSEDEKQNPHPPGKTTLIVDDSWLSQVHTVNTTKGNYFWFKLFFYSFQIPTSFSLDFGITFRLIIFPSRTEASTTVS
jgi:hypothetical protein